MVIAGSWTALDLVRSASPNRVLRSFLSVVVESFLIVVQRLSSLVRARDASVATGFLRKRGLRCWVLCLAVGNLWFVVARSRTVLLS